MSMLSKYVMSSEYLLNARASELSEYIVLQYQQIAMNGENKTVTKTDNPAYTLIYHE